MIYFTKIEDNVLQIKFIDNSNVFSLYINIKIDKMLIVKFREFYHNIHKNITSKITCDNVTIEFNDNIVKFENNNIHFKINRTNDIVDMFDKIITNLMINDLEVDSPRYNINDKFDK